MAGSKISITKCLLLVMLFMDCALASSTGEKKRVDCLTKCTKVYVKCVEKKVKENKSSEDCTDTHAQCTRLCNWLFKPENSKKQVR